MIFHYRRLCSPITGRPKCSKNEAFLVALMAKKEGRPDWWRIGHDAFTHSQICAITKPVGRGQETLLPVAQTLAQLTRWTGERRPPIFTDSIENRGRPGASTAIQANGIFPFFCKASVRNLFLNYRNRGPPRRVGRDTDKGKYSPLSVRRLSCFFFKIIGTSARHGGPTAMKTMVNIFFGCKASRRNIFRWPGNSGGF